LARSAHGVELVPAGLNESLARQHAFESFLGAPRRLRILAAARCWNWIRGVGRSRALDAKASE
jgi:hypothetical protein